MNVANSTNRRCQITSTNSLICFINGENREFNTATLSAKRGQVPGTFNVENYLTPIEPVVKIGKLAININPGTMLYELSDKAKLEVVTVKDNTFTVHDVLGPELIQERLEEPSDISIM